MVSHGFPFLPETCGPGNVGRVVARKGVDHAASGPIDWRYTPYITGGFKPSEKYELVNWDDYSKYMGNFKKMFQTTNQHHI